MSRMVTTLSGIIILIMTAISFAGDCGDVDNSGGLNILDVGYIIDYLYKGGPAPFCCGDVDSSGNVSILDAAYLISYLYKGGPTAFCPTVTDIDGNTYQAVKIGNQWWMAENLKVTHYRNGDAMPNVTDRFTWIDLTTGAYCEYDNDVNNVAAYGRLYNWFAVSDSRNIAPEGWHVASDAEWKQLEMYLGMSQAEADAMGDRGTNEGGKMKEAGTAHWIYANNGATNESGFSALPGGRRDYGGNYDFIGQAAYFLTSTEASSHDAWHRVLDCGSLRISRSCFIMPLGFSVRCVKD